MVFICLVNVTQFLAQFLFIQLVLRVECCRFHVFFLFVSIEISLGIHTLLRTVNFSVRC